MLDTEALLLCVDQKGLPPVLDPFYTSTGDNRTQHLFRHFSAVYNTIFLLFLDVRFIAQILTSPCYSSGFLFNTLSSMLKPEVNFLLPGLNLLQALLIHDDCPLFREPMPGVQVQFLDQLVSLLQELLNMEGRFDAIVHIFKALDILGEDVCIRKRLVSKVSPAVFQLLSYPPADFSSLFGAGGQVLESSSQISHNTFGLILRVVGNLHAYFGKFDHSSSLFNEILQLSQEASQSINQVRQTPSSSKVLQHSGPKDVQSMFAGLDQDYESNILRNLLFLIHLQFDQGADSKLAIELGSVCDLYRKLQGAFSREGAFDS